MKIIDVLVLASKQDELFKRSWGTKSSYRRLIKEGGVRLLERDNDGKCIYTKIEDCNYQVKAGDRLKIGKFRFLEIAT